MNSPASTAILEHPVDRDEFRRVLGHFCSGVTIVTAVTADSAATSIDGAAEREEVPVGFSCQSFASLSLTPPLVTFLVGRESTTWPRIAEAGQFCVNILATEQEELCRAFAVSGADKFSGVEWAPAPATGSPVLAGSLAWVDCTVEAVHPGGDHWIVIGRVRALDATAGSDPLLFYRAGFSRPAA